MRGLGAALAERADDPERTERVEPSADAFARKTEGDQDDLVLAGDGGDGDEGTRDRTGTNRAAASPGAGADERQPDAAGGATYTSAGDTSNRGAGAAVAESRGTNGGAASRGAGTQTNGVESRAGGGTFTGGGDSAPAPAGQAAGTRDMGNSRPAAQPAPAQADHTGDSRQSRASVSRDSDT